MPALPPFRATRSWVAATLILSLLALAGCETRASREREYRREAAMSMGIPKVSLHGSGTFFGGTLVAEAVVSRGLHTELMADDEVETGGNVPAVKLNPLSGSSRSDSGNGMHSSVAGSNSGAPGGMAAGYGGSEGGGLHGDEGDARARQNSDDWTETNSDGGKLVSVSFLGSTAPPISLRLRLVNKGTETLTVETLDINSDLGNFVPDPEKVVLYPGRSIELTPMVSRLGVVAAEIPLKLSFRVGQMIEAQTVLLRTPPTPASTRPAAAPAPASAAP